MGTNKDMELVNRLMVLILQDKLNFEDAESLILLDELYKKGISAMGFVTDLKKILNK